MGLGERRCTIQLMRQIVCVFGFLLLVTACVSKLPPTDAKEFAAWCQRQGKVVKYTSVGDAVYTRECVPRPTAKPQ